MIQNSVFLFLFLFFSLTLVKVCVGDELELNVCVPDVFIIGVTKGGTTSLEELLDRHGQVCTGKSKEKHYFEGRMTQDAYIKEYENCLANQLKLDKTPSYIRSEVAAKRIKMSYTAEQLSKKKFILVLRDPVLRMYSEFQMALRYCNKLFVEDDADDMSRTKAEALLARAKSKKTLSSGRSDKSSRWYSLCQQVATNTTRAKTASDLTFKSFSSYQRRREKADGGSYVRQLQRWTKNLPRSQLLIFNMNHVIMNTTASSHALAAFLQLDSDFGREVTLSRLNVHNYSYSDSVGGLTGNIRKPRAPPLTCSGVKEFQRRRIEDYDELHKLINDAPDRPVMEPYFQPFQRRDSLDKCV